MRLTQKTNKAVHHRILQKVQYPRSNNKKKTPSINKDQPKPPLALSNTL